jgi:hypothetical protein
LSLTLGQGIALRYFHTLSSTDLLGDLEQIDVSQYAKNHRHDHVSRPTTVDAAHLSSYLSVDCRVVDYCG